MTWRAVGLILTLFLNQTFLGPDMNSFASDTSAKGQIVDRNSDIHCTVSTRETRWRLTGEAPVIRVKMQVRKAIHKAVMPSIQLTALPKKEGIHKTAYWAPFSVASGKSTSEWAKLDSTSRASLISVTLLPSELLWASTKSSVWPSDRMLKTVPPGEYSLQVQVEVQGGETFVSNEVHVTILE